MLPCSKSIALEWDEWWEIFWMKLIPIFSFWFDFEKIEFKYVASEEDKEIDILLHCKIERD